MDEKENPKSLDEYEFENRYEIDEAVYMDWATHPVGKVAKKRARMMLVMTVIEAVLSLLLIVMGVINTVPLYIAAGALFAVYLVINRFVLQPRKERKRFRSMCAGSGCGSIRRVMRFGEKISVEDAGKATVFDYSYITEITQDDRWYYLWINPSSAYRAKKGAFTKGEEKDFAAFIRKAIKKK